MPKFTVFTHVHNGFDSVAFKPGDIVPDWAIGKVNNRVHDGGVSEVTLDTLGADSGGTAPVVESEDQGENPLEDTEDTEDTGDAEGDEGDEGEDATESEETGEVEELGEPDFTKPAPAKRKPGRPRKTV